jgi:hypothetical protein
MWRASCSLLASQIKYDFETGKPLLSSAVYSDLLTAAICKVAWLEIASTFLNELTEA